MLFAETPPYVTYAFLGVMAATIGILLLRTQRHYRRRRTSDDSREIGDAMETRSRGHRLDDPAMVAQWEVQMHDTARELSAQLDTKMGLLAQLIREADRAAARLDAALANRQEKIATADPGFAPDPTLSPSSDLFSTPPVSQAEGLKSGIATEPPQAKSREGVSEPRSSADRRYDEIYTLADYGYDAVEISRRVGAPIGEVQLILSLRKSR